MKMQEMRQKQAVATRGRASDLASNTLLKEIARLAPASLDALDAIPGFKTSGMRNDGPQIVTFISALRESEGV
jgi:ribonuclease D